MPTTTTDEPTTDQTPTTDPEPSASDLADRLEEGAEIRRLPEPPPFLEGRPWEHVVKPYWDEVVRLLGERGEGYPTLRGVESRLRPMADEFAVQVLTRSERRHALELLTDALREEVVHAEEPPGGDGTVGANPSREGAWWTWETEQGHARLFELRSENGAWEEWKEELRSLRRAYPTQRWTDLHERAQAALFREEESLNRLERREVTARFRAELLAQVLLEFEMLGYVGPLELEAEVERPSERTDVSRFGPEEQAWVLAAKEMVDADPEGRTAPTTIFQQIDDRLVEYFQRIEPPFSWYEGKAIRVAERARISAYEPIRGEGTRPDERGVNRRQKLADRVRDLAHALSEAGVNSLGDIWPSGAPEDT